MVKNQISRVERLKKQVETLPLSGTDKTIIEAQLDEVLDILSDLPDEPGFLDEKLGLIEALVEGL